MSSRNTRTFRSFYAVVGLPGGKESQTNKYIEVDINISDLKEAIFDVLILRAKDNGFITRKDNAWPNRLRIIVSHQREEFAEHILGILQDFQINRTKILCMIAENNESKLYSAPKVIVETFLPETAEQDQSVAE